MSEKLKIPKRIWVTWAPSDWQANGVNEEGCFWLRSAVIKKPGETLAEYVLVKVKEPKAKK